MDIPSVCLLVRLYVCLFFRLFVYKFFRMFICSIGSFYFRRSNAIRRSVGWSVRQMVTSYFFRPTKSNACCAIHSVYTALFSYQAKLRLTDARGNRMIVAITVIYDDDVSDNRQL